MPKLVLNELLVFLARPTTMPSHRVYCLGFLNKFAKLDNPLILKQILGIYFGLFNKLLHQEPGQKFDMELEAKKLKKDRTMSKKQRSQSLKKLRKRKTSDLDEEDNKVIELVLKGINIILVSKGDS